MMKIQTPLFRTQSNQIALVARGVLNIAGFHQILVEIHRLSEFRPECEVVIDLVDATYALQPSEIDDLIRQIPWSRRHQIALIARNCDHFNQLSLLSACLLKHGIQTAVFYDANVAVEWLRHRSCTLE